MSLLHSKANAEALKMRRLMQTLMDQNTALVKRCHHLSSHRMACPTHPVDAHWILKVLLLKRNKRIERMKRKAIMKWKKLVLQHPNIFKRVVPLGIRQRPLSPASDVRGRTTVKFTHVDSLRNAKEKKVDLEMTALREQVKTLGGTVQKQKELVEFLRTAAKKTQQRKVITPAKTVQVKEEISAAVRVRLQNLQLENADLTKMINAKHESIISGLTKLEDIKKRHKDSNFIIDQLKIKNESLTLEKDDYKDALEVAEKMNYDLQSRIKSKDNHIRSLSNRKETVVRRTVLPKSVKKSTPHKVQKQHELTRRVSAPATKASFKSLVARKMTFNSAIRKISQAKIADTALLQKQQPDSSSPAPSSKSYAASILTSCSTIQRTSLSKITEATLPQKQHDSPPPAPQNTISNKEQTTLEEIASSAQGGEMEIKLAVKSISNDQEKSSPTSSPTLRIPSRRGSGKHRATVYTQEVTTENLETTIVSNTISVVTIELISASLSKMSLLSLTSKEEKQSAARATKEVTFKAGEEIITQGTPGSILYVIESGQVNVLIDNEKVAELSSGRFFGELALYSGEDRNATVTAKTSVKLRSLDRKSFRTMLAQSSQAQLQGVVEALTTVPLLESLTKGQILKLASGVSVETFKAGNTIVNKGDASDKFFLLQKGTCHVVDTDFGENEILLKPGTYFGERGLIEDKLREATVVALDHVTCFSLARETCIDLLGPLAAVIKKRKIADALYSVKWFCHLSSQEHNKLADVVKTESFAQDKMIIRKGDMCEYFYIIFAGQVLVQDGSTLSVGAYFGEGTLIGRSFHTQSIIAQGETCCYAISKKVLAAILGTVDVIRARITMGIVMQSLSNMPLFAEYPTSFLRRASFAFEFVNFTAGQMILKRDEPAMDFYVICDGTACNATHPDDTDLSIGDSLGLESFEKELQNECTITAKTVVRCAQLSQENYDKFLSLDAISNYEEDSDSEDDEDGEEDEEDGRDTSVELKNLDRIKIIGSGSTGRVIAVRDKISNKMYALKEMSKMHIEAENQKLNVVNEVKILKKCKHPNIVNIHTTLQNESSVQLLLDFIPGGDLLNVMERSPSSLLQSDSAAFYAANILLALGYLHDRNIAYRDLKPENVLIDAQGYAILVDFGYAKKIRDTERSYTLCGNPNYIAPEMIIARGHSHAVDYWSFGILLFDMLFGYTPFDDFKNHNPIKVWKKVMKGKLIFPLFADDASKDIIQKLLRPNAVKRLGMGCKGIEEIRSHEWFNDIDFEALFNRSATPPWTPELNSDIDTQYFIEQRDAPPADEGKFMEHESSEWIKHF